MCSSYQIVQSTRQISNRTSAAFGSFLAIFPRPTQEFESGAQIGICLPRIRQLAVKFRLAKVIWISEARGVECHLKQC